MALTMEHAVTTAIQQKKNGVDAKITRLEDIRKNEDLYNNIVPKALKGRFNVPFPFMGGFVDTLMSEIDDPPVIKFEHQHIADYKKAKRTTAAWEKESKAITPNANWEQKDRWTKKLAAFSGRAIAKIFSESDPDYKSYFEVIDHHDFYNEPNGGGDNEMHLFCGQENIFRTKGQLRRGARNGLYLDSNVERLFNAMASEDYKKTIDAYKSKLTRHSSLGLDPETNNYTGQPIVNLTEHYMDFEGIRYYLLFHEPTGIAVRFKPLEELFGSRLYPHISWATHEDPFVFWTKAPCDDMRPVAYAMQKLLNQELENREKRNFNQRAYDPEMFSAADLEFRPGGLTPVDVPKGKNIRDGIFEFQTPELQGTVNLVEYLDAMSGKKTGVTNDSQGMSSEQKVGIYFGNMQQIAKRMGLFNKSYSGFYKAGGYRYAMNLIENCPEKMMVKMIGERGIEWEQISNPDDIKPLYDFSIEVKGGNEDAKANANKLTKRENVLKGIQANPILAQEVNKKWLLKELLSLGEYSEDEIKVAMDPTDEHDMEILSEAAQENEDLLHGKTPKPNRGATPAHIQKHIDAAYELDIKKEVLNAILKHIDQEMPIAQENMVRKANMLNMVRQMTAGMPQEAGGGNMPQNRGVGGAPVNIPTDNPEMAGSPAGYGNRATNQIKQGNI